MGDSWGIGRGFWGVRRRPRQCNSPKKIVKKSKIDEIDIKSVFLDL